MSFCIRFDASCTWSPSNSNVSLHLSPSAAIVIIQFQQSNEFLRVSIQNAPSLYKPYVQSLLQFRNRYAAWKQPFLHTAFPYSPPNVNGSNKKLPHFYRWPVPAAVLETPKFSTESPTEISLSLVSLDKLVRIQLHPVTLNVLVHFNASLVDSDSLASCEQEFSALDPPPVWQYPVALLRKTTGDESYQESKLQEIALSLPGSVITESYVSIPTPPPCTDVFPSHSSNLAFNMSSEAIPVRIMNTDTALYRMLALPSDQARFGSLAVEAILYEDGTLVRSDETFSFVSLLSSEGFDKVNVPMFSAKDTPETVRNWVSGREYPLRKVVLEMSRIYVPAYIWKSQSNPKKPSSEPNRIERARIESRTAVQVCNVPGVGMFTAFSDGTVEAFVEARAARIQILEDCRPVVMEMDLTLKNTRLDQMVARISSPTSEFDDLVVRVVNAVGFEEEMSHVVQFIFWVFQDPKEAAAISEARKKIRFLTEEALLKSKGYLSK